MRVLWFLRFRDGGGGGGEKERERWRWREIPGAVRRCPRTASPLCVSLDYLLPLHPSLHPPPSHPPLPAVTRAMGRQPRRLLVLPLLLPPSHSLSPLPPLNPPPPTLPNPPYSPLGLAEARMRKPRMEKKKKKGKGGAEEEQQILIHLMAPIFFSHMI